MDISYQQHSERDTTSSASQKNEASSGSIEFDVQRPSQIASQVRLRVSGSDRIICVPRSCWQQPKPNVW